MNLERKEKLAWQRILKIPNLSETFKRLTVLGVIKMVVSILDTITGVSEKHPSGAEGTSRQGNVSQFGHLAVSPWACFLGPLSHGLFIYKMGW